MAGKFCIQSSSECLPDLAAMKTDITIKDLSKASGYSKATISRVLHNHPKVSAATRESVLSLIRESGYKPNPLISAHMAMMRQRFQLPRDGETLALLTSLPLHVNWNQSSSQNLVLQGVYDRAKELGFKIEEFMLRKWEGHTGRLSQILQARGIRGILVGPMHHGLIKIDLDWDRFSSVSIGHSFRNPHLHRVCSDNFHNLYTAMGILHDRGYQRIGIVMDMESDYSSCQIWLGSYMGFEINKFHSMNIPPLLIYPDQQPKNDPSLITLIRDYVVTHNLDAIVGYSYVLEILNKAGIHVPDDCAFADISIEGETKTAGINERRAECGAQSVDLLAELLYLNNTGIPKNPKNVLITGAWTDGWTVADKPDLQITQKAPGFIPGAL